MGQITDLARTLLRGGIGVRDANKLISEAKKNGVTPEEKTELTSILNSSEFADKFTAKGKETLQRFLGAPVPIAPNPPSPSGPLRSVQELVPADLGSVSDGAALPEKFKADYARLAPQLVGHPSLSENDKATRTMEFFQAYAARFTSTFGYGADEDQKTASAKKFGAVLKEVGFGAMVNADKDKDGVAAGVEILLGDSPEAFTARADHKSWTTTYWPWAGNLNDSNGSPSSNLWATNGAADKFDKLLAARGKETGALAHERQSAVNWMLGNSDIMKGQTRPDDAKKVGYHMPNSTLKEKDTERTTGVDFNANGKLDADVAWDFLDGYGNFGTDGKTEGTMSTSWWGSCPSVAIAGNLFKEPKKDVTLNGVTFTAQEIKGLLTLIADSQGPVDRWKGDRYDANYDSVRLKNGTTLRGRIEGSLDLAQPGARRAGDDVTLTTGFPSEIKMSTTAGESKTLKASEIASITREDKRDDAAAFHTAGRDWLASGTGAVMDKDNGEHVWNYNFWKLEDRELTEKPTWAPAKLVGTTGQPAGDGKITYVERAVTLGGGGSEEHYKYWIEEKNGKIVNSGWAEGSTNPDFLWGSSRNVAPFSGRNERNPFIDPALVKELYEKAIEP